VNIEPGNKLLQHAFDPTTNMLLFTENDPLIVE